MSRAALERILGTVRKEFLQTFRDPRMLRVLFLAPIIQLIVFGYAVSTDIRNTSTFVVDHDRSQASRQLVDALTASGYFRVTGRSARPADLVRALDHGDALVGVEIPAGFEARLYEGRGAGVQILLDGTQSNTATVAQSYAERIVLSYGARALGLAAASAVDLRDRAWYNPGLESRNYNVPAVIGMIVMLVCLLLTALAVVREREIGTLEQLRVSPLRPVELIAGKAIPFALLGLADLVVITTVALFWFDVPFRGDFVLLVVASLLFIASGLGVGLLISTFSATQQEAFMATFLFFMPTILLSGFLFPVSSMPEVFQWLTLANPLRHYVEVVRAVFLKGTGAVILWPQLLALTIIGGVVFGAAIERFRRSIE